MSIFNPIDLQILDQLLHVLWGLGILLAAWHLRRWWWGWGLTAAMFDAPREFIDQWPIRADSDWYIDLAFFFAGGALAWLLVNRPRLLTRRRAVALAALILAVVATETFAKEIAVEACQGRAKIIRGLASKVGADRVCLVRTRTSYLDTDLHKGYMPIEDYIRSGDLDRRRWW